MTVTPNTNYTVRVSGVTRLKKNGDIAEAYCTMPPTIPDKQKLSKFNWSKVEDKDKYMFKLFMPRINERNGPICCYRVYMVKMEPQQRLSELPMPEELSVMSYQEAHRTPKGGAYVAEMFTSETIVPEVFLGDDQVVNTSASPCDQCVGLRPYSTPDSTVNYTVNRSRRNDNEEPLPPYDGGLDMNSNYTAFIEILGKFVNFSLTKYKQKFGHNFVSLVSFGRLNIGLYFLTFLCCISITKKLQSLRCIRKIFVSNTNVNFVSFFKV